MTVILREICTVPGWTENSNLAGKEDAATLLSGADGLPGLRPLRKQRSE
jgi:hypothetical protein